MTKITISGKAFRGLKWTKEGDDHVSGPFRIVKYEFRSIMPGRKLMTLWIIWIDKKQIHSVSTLPKAFEWCNDQAKQALALSSQLVVIEE